MEIPKQVRSVDHFEYNTQISSNYVSHFTSKFETLLEIVDKGFLINGCNEIEVYKKDYFELEVLSNFYTAIAGSTDKPDELIHKIPMVCFCDIPIKFAKRHVKEFGRYCIAMTKKWAISNGLSPIIYMPSNSRTHVILRSINSLKDRLVNIKDNNGIEIPEIIQLNQQLEKLFEYIKPYINKVGDYKFYDEREWRYLSKLIDNSKKQYLVFSKTDFHFALVQKAQEKHILLERLRNKFGYISSKRIKIKLI